MEGKRIALTGGIATGKSTVAGMFANLGAVILDADATARRLVEPGTNCWHRLRDLLGEQFFQPDGQLRRRDLRNKIIEDPELRAQVNSILHPAILEAMDLRWKEWQDKNPQQLILFDIPLLFERGLHTRFDVVILAYVPRDVQIARLMIRDGVTRIEAEKTLSMQHPIESKKKHAHIVIDNTLDQDHTFRQVKSVWDSLTRVPAGNDKR